MARPLTIAEILSWIDKHREMTGNWPSNRDGRIPGTVFETWLRVDRALNHGKRGLPGGSSLAHLIHTERGGRFSHYTPDLSVEQILEMADAHFRAQGEYPTRTSGPVLDHYRESWSAINSALECGCRGFPGGASLAQLLAEHRGVRNVGDLPALSEEQILAWADAWHERTGQWPSQSYGLIPDSGDETWTAIDKALYNGGRGLPGGSSLARLLGERRGVRNQLTIPKLDIATILSWADRHKEQMGDWPTYESGPILGVDDETWHAIDAALVQGGRGLPSGSSLAKLLAEHRGRRNIHDLPKLKSRDILAWADAHFERTGKWPTAKSGDIPEAPGESWKCVATALLRGIRGLKAGTSLAKLLSQHRGKRNHKDLPPLRQREILEWADAHFQRTGEWPTRRSGAIPEAPGESWSGVDAALCVGWRGQPGGNSITKLLERKRGARNQSNLPPFSVEQILTWADRHKEQTGDWPKPRAGPISGTDGETWYAVQAALVNGNRGLPGGSSIAKLLIEHRGKRTRGSTLNLDDVRRWAEAHRQKHGRWPTDNSGPIEDAPGETWTAVFAAFAVGRRGVPKGSLSRILREQAPDTPNTKE